jgi:hypothetical protein
MIQDFIRNKNVLFAFGDPGGAKQVLSFATKYRNLFNSVVAVSDRIHPFYQDFDVNVEDFKSKTPQEWLSSTKVDLLVTGTSVPLSLEIILVSEASKHGVASMSFIDHWTNMAKRFRVADSLVLPDWICVIDDRARMLAIENELPAEKIWVTGNPYYEFLAAWKPKINHDDFLMDMGIPRDAKYVLYAPEPLSSFGLEKKYGFTELEGIHLIYEAMGRLLGDTIYIIIKGHSNQKHEIFLDYVAKQEVDHVLYFQTLDINTCSYYAECVFGFFSNSLVEAKILGRKVIRPLVLLRDGVDDSLEVMESSNFITTRSLVDLEIACRQIVIK